MDGRAVNPVVSIKTISSVCYANLSRWCEGTLQILTAVAIVEIENELVNLFDIEWGKIDYLGTRSSK